MDFMFCSATNTSCSAASCRARSCFFNFHDATLGNLQFVLGRRLGVGVGQQLLRFFLKGGRILLQPRLARLHLHLQIGLKRLDELHACLQ